jgi:hypothetical protein
VGNFPDPRRRRHGQPEIRQHDIRPFRFQELEIHLDAFEGLIFAAELGVPQLVTAQHIAQRNIDDVLNRKPRSFHELRFVASHRKGNIRASRPKLFGDHQCARRMRENFTVRRDQNVEAAQSGGAGISGKIGRTHRFLRRRRRHGSI